MKLLKVNKVYVNVDHISDVEICENSIKVYWGNETAFRHQNRVEVSREKIEMYNSLLDFLELYTVWNVEKN